MNDVQTKYIITKMQLARIERKIVDVMRQYGYLLDGTRDEVQLYMVYEKDFEKEYNLAEAKKNLERATIRLINWGQSLEDGSYEAKEVQEWLIKNQFDIEDPIERFTKALISI